MHLDALLARVLAPWVSHPEAISTLEIRMAATDDLVARLNAATTAIAAELKSLRDEVAGADASIAAKFEPLISQLEAMGTDSDNPVPGDGGDTPVEPTA